MRFIFILLLLIGSVAQTIYAQEDGSSAAGLVTPTARHLDYALVYPGILPNNPLYPIKMIRDKIVLFLITDPVKRAAFNLLQADKRLAAGILLLQEDKKNEALAITTIEKGENYFHEAMNQAFQIKREGRDVKGFIQKLDSALEKHTQDITGLKKDVSNKGVRRINDILVRLKTYQALLQASR